MSQTVEPKKPSPLRWLVRGLGLVLLAVLLARLDRERILAVLRTADLTLLLLAFFGTLPLIFIKTVRWQGVLRAQGMHLATGPAYLAYFSSLFIGFLTPGRLGEFVKALYVRDICGVSGAKGFFSVLVDRLFDLALLIVVGSAALPAIIAPPWNLAIFAGLALAFTLPLVLLASAPAFAWMQRIGQRVGKVGAALVGPGGLLTEVHRGIHQLSVVGVTKGAVLTVLAYGVYFGQCILIARALGITVSPLTVTFAVALGSLITLVPISISGLGTRDATMIAYLSLFAVPAEQAISFSLLVFAVFYIGGGVTGGIAWLIRPVSLRDLHQLRATAD